MVTRQILLRVFDIDWDAGRFFWKEPPWNHPRLLGTEAGCARPTHNEKYYWVIKVGKAHRRGRLMFLAAHGRWPEPCLDHIDGDSLNDRLNNIREATVTENAWNHKRRSRRIPLPMGVRLNNKSGRYSARISVHGKQIHLGAYDTPEQAAEAYQTKRGEFYGDFA
jgi:hypothetical protein